MTRTSPKIYLDYAAATPVNDTVLTAMKPFFSNDFYNPSALYGGARSVKSSLEESRASVAKSIGSRPSEVTFTAGGTESANLAIHGVMQRYPDGELIVSAIEHDAVLMPASQYDPKMCPVDEKGKVVVAKLEKLITDTTVLISVMYANNEIGTIQPIKEITELVSQVRVSRIERNVKTPLYVHTDACQAPNYLDVNVARLGVDLMTLNGGKIYGPKQSGVLYHKVGVDLKAQITGGGQELGIRSGTENVAFAVGFAKALEIAVRNRQNSAKQMTLLTKTFIEVLKQKHGALLNGHPRLRLPNNVHVTFPNVDNERVLFSLDEQGVWAAAGSACSASSEVASHVLVAIGLSEAAARGSLRFSLGRQTTEEQLSQTLEALEIALKA